MGLELAVGGLRDRIQDVRRRPAADLLVAVRRRVRYENRSFGLRRDLTVPFEPPQPRIALQVRPLEQRDLRLLDDTLPGLDDEERVERRVRRRMLDAGLQTPYVAVTEDDDPAYVQWLVGPEQNDLLQRLFHGLFPVLAEDEVLLEGAFTPAAHRGKRVMPYAMAVIGGLGAERGARSAYTFVSQENAASLAGCARSGFHPVMTRIESWHGFRRHLEFGPLPAGVVQ